MSPLHFTLKTKLNFKTFSQWEEAYFSRDPPFMEAFFWISRAPKVFMNLVSFAVLDFLE